ncbi:hypothetical protein [Pararhizobium sp.]|uniref:hypothetical protein n=1 Tax=Pararhizobium sp. TaxID=1977563 RepID=UPI003D135F66
MLVLYVGLIVIGLLGARINLVGARGGQVDQAVLILALSVAATIATLSLFVWGFIYLKWYWPVVAFVAGTIFGMVVTRNSWASLAAARPVMDAAVVAGAIFIWFLK